jgi:hypothetical protein
MRTENPIRDAAYAIQQQRDKLPKAKPENPRDARLRTQIERERKEKPMTGSR